MQLPMCMNPRTGDVNSDVSIIYYWILNKYSPFSYIYTCFKIFWVFMKQSFQFIPLIISNIKIIIKFCGSIFSRHKKIWRADMLTRLVSHSQRKPPCDSIVDQPYKIFWSVWLRGSSVWKNLIYSVSFQYYKVSLVWFINWRKVFITFEV